MAGFWALLGRYLWDVSVWNSIFASGIYLLIMHHMHELCVLHEYLVYSNIVRISFDQPWTFRIAHNPQMSGCVTVNTTLDDKERCCFYLLWHLKRYEKPRTLRLSRYIVKSQLPTEKIHQLKLIAQEPTHVKLTVKPQV